MMRCIACNKNLSDKESTFKDARGEYTDMCFECLSYVFDSLDEEDDNERSESADEGVDKDQDL